MSRTSAIALGALLIWAFGCGQVEAPRSQVAVRPAATAAELEVRWIANEGFLIEGAGRRVLVDGLFGPDVTGYPVCPPEMRDRLEQGAGEWAGIDVAIASHYHPDHFHPDSVARFLSSSPDAVFVSTPQVIDRLKKRLSPDSPLLGRTRAVFPAEGEVERLEIDGVEIEVLNLHHGRLDPPVENLGVVVTLGGSRFLHFGDTEAKMDTFEPYLGLLADIDVGLFPFWFLASDWRVEMVRDLIRPRAAVVAHLPLPTAPANHFARWQSYENLVSVIEANFPAAWIPHAPGETFHYPSD